MRSWALSGALVLCMIAAGCGDPLDRIREGMTVAQVKSVLGGEMGEPSTPASVESAVEVLDLPEGARAEDVEVSLCVDQEGQAYLIWFCQGRVIRVQKTTVPKTGVPGPTPSDTILPVPQP